MVNGASEDKPKAVRIDGDIYRRLGEATERSGRTVTEEVRQRLELSLDAEKIDLRTRELTDAITSLATVLALNDNWYEDRFGFEVFKEGVFELLGRYQPPGEPVVSTPKLPRVHYGPGDDAKTAGRMLARWVVQEMQKQTSTK